MAQRRQIQILCDGGLGNRLGSLIGGLVVAQRLDCQITVHWPQNNWCRAKFTDLFEPTIDYTGLSVTRVFTKFRQNCFLIHENQSKLSLAMTFPHTLESLNNLTVLESDIVYYHNKWPPYFSEQELRTALQQLTIKREVLNTVQDFVNKHNISDRVFGLHLRKTDNQTLDEDKFYDIVQRHSHEQYFICSDDRATELRFCSLPNVCAYSKTSYVRKMIEGGWLAQTVDADGRMYNYNINRPRISVVQAFVDMLILSRTTIQPTVKKSSFSRTAQLYSTFDIFKNETD